MTYKKDNKIYFFNSKYKSLNNLYHLTKEDKKEVNKKIDKQKSYLKSHVLSFHGTDESKSLLDLSYGANINPDIYFSEMNNRVNSLLQYSKDINFNEAIFITLTAKSEHKPLKSISLGSNRFKMIDNPKFNGNPDNVREAREYLSDSWSNYTKNRVFQDIKDKYGLRYVYMKTYEPTLDGVPHAHILLFVPKEFKERVIKACSTAFKHSRHDIKTNFDDGAGGVAAYIMKYILKSFKNSKTNTFDDVGYWYAKHKILRFTTSRTLLPLKIYRLIKGNTRCRNYLEMTKKYNEGMLYFEKQQKDFYDFRPTSELKSVDFFIKDIYLIDDDYRTYKHNNVYSKSEDYEIEIYTPSEHVKMKWVKPPDKPIPIYNEQSEKIGYFHDSKIKLFSTTKSPHELDDMQLYRYFHSLDIEEVNLQHFGYVKNCMIDRGLLDDKKSNLNDYIDYASFDF
jgi:hypothetical protein